MLSSPAALFRKGNYSNSLLPAGYSNYVQYEAIATHSSRPGNAGIAMSALKLINFPPTSPLGSGRNKAEKDKSNAIIKLVTD